MTPPVHVSTCVCVQANSSDTVKKQRLSACMHVCIHICVHVHVYIVQ